MTGLYEAGDVNQEYGAGDVNVDDVDDVDTWSRSTKPAT